jgi:hypothetical protein
VLAETYVDSNLEIKEPDAENEAKDNADTRSKILRDIISIINAHGHQNAPYGLEEDCSPLYLNVSKCFAALNEI